MTAVSIRSRLPGDALLAAGIGAALITVGGLVRFGVGWDAHAYYVAWPDGLYDVPPGQMDAYNYSPVFAQVIYPLTLLPWPVFCLVFVAAAAAGVTWLVRPLPLVPAIGLWMVCLPEIASGNIYWLLAVCAVLGVSRGSPWCASLFTKVLPTVGPVWFAVRREWSLLLGFLGAAAVVLALSYATNPQAWAAWLEFLSTNSEDADVASLPGVPPLWLRLPLALVVTVYAARVSRAWLLAVAMLLATPIVGAGSFALLAAIPRLRLSVNEVHRSAVDG